MTKMLVLGYGMSEFWLRWYDEQVKLNFKNHPTHIYSLNPVPEATGARFPQIRVDFVAICNSNP